jgi:hypothetical protein
MRNSYRISAALVVALALVAAVALAATPVPNGAVVSLKIWNDSPQSVASVINNYPAMIKISDIKLNGCGFANLHNWTFSTDGGVTPASFDNNAMFRFATDVTTEGTGDGEACIRISPWWAHDGDGEFMLNTRTGEIAIFGGRLPFYSFTGNFGLTYAKGDVVRLEMIYLPNDLNAGNPATITYKITKPTFGVTYSSGPLAFDEANPSEDPPHGLWGMLNDAQVGGMVKAYADCGNDEARLRVTWSRIEFYGAGLTPTATPTWGKLRNQYR